MNSINSYDLSQLPLGTWGVCKECWHAAVFHSIGHCRIDKCACSHGPFDNCDIEEKPFTLGDYQRHLDALPWAPMSEVHKDFSHEPPHVLGRRLPVTPVLLAFLDLPGIIPEVDAFQYRNTLMDPPHLKPGKRFRILSRDGFRCRYCGRNTEQHQTLVLQVDHIVPRSRGGGDEENNLVTACWECNIGKGAKLLQ